MKKTIIGICGVKTSGKSTAADIIKDILNGNISESALAGKLKDVSAKVFGLTRDDFDNQDIKEVPFSDGPKTLTLEKIEEILLSFNTTLTEELTDKYIESGIIDMYLGTPRVIAQIVGTEVLRATGNVNIHCENMPLNENGITVVSDLRFPNEFDYFNNEDFNFLPIYIQRDEAESFVTEDSHQSEKCVFEFSEKCNKIPNNGSLEQLNFQIIEFLEDSGLFTKESKEA